MSKFKIGSVVRLKAEEYQYLHLTSPEAFEQAKKMHITKIENINGPKDPPIFVIEVAEPLMNQFLLDTSMVELIE